MHLRRLKESLDRAGIPFCYATSPVCRGESPTGASIVPCTPSVPTRTPSPPRPLPLPAEAYNGDIDQATLDRTSADISFNELLAESSAAVSNLPKIPPNPKETVIKPPAPHPSSTALVENLQDALNQSGLDIAPDVSLAHKSQLLERQLDEVVSLVLAYTANTMVADTIDALLSCFGETFTQSAGGNPCGAPRPCTVTADVVVAAAATACAAARHRTAPEAMCPASLRRNSANLLLAKRGARRVAAAAAALAQHGTEARRSGFLRDVRSANRAARARSSHRLRSARAHTEEATRRNFASKSSPYVLCAPNHKRPPPAHAASPSPQHKAPRLFRKDVAAEAIRFFGSTPSQGEVPQKLSPTREVRVDRVESPSRPETYNPRPRSQNDPTQLSPSSSVTTLSQHSIQLLELPSNVDNCREMTFGGQERASTRALAEKMADKCMSRPAPERTMPYAVPERPASRPQMEHQPFRGEAPNSLFAGSSYRLFASGYGNYFDLPEPKERSNVPAATHSWETHAARTRERLYYERDREAPPPVSPSSLQKVRSRERTAADRDVREKDVPIPANAVTARRDRGVVADRESSPPRRERPPAADRERERENDGMGPAKRVFDPRRRPNPYSPPCGYCRNQSARFKPDIVWAASTPQGWAKIRAAKAAAAAIRQQMAAQGVTPSVPSRSRLRLEGQTHKGKGGGAAETSRGGKLAHRRRVSLKNRRNFGHRRYSPTVDGYPEPAKYTSRKDGRCRHFHSKAMEVRPKSRSLSHSRPASRNRSPMSVAFHSPSRNRSRPRSPAPRPASRSRGRAPIGETASATPVQPQYSTTAMGGGGAQGTSAAVQAPNATTAMPKTTRTAYRKRRRGDDAPLPPPLATQSVGIGTVDCRRPTSTTKVNEVAGAAGTSSFSTKAPHPRGAPKGFFPPVAAGRLATRLPASGVRGVSPVDDDASVATDDTSCSTSTTTTTTLGGGREKTAHRPSVSSSSTLNTTRFTHSSTKVDSGGADGDTRLNLDSDRDDSDAAPTRMPDPPWHQSARKGLPVFHCCTTDDIFFDTKNRFIQKKSKDAGDTTQKEEVMENLDAVTGPAEVESWVGVAREARSSASERYRQELHVMMAGLLDSPAPWARAATPLPLAQSPEVSEKHDSVSDSCNSMHLATLAQDDSTPPLSDATSTSSLGARESVQLVDSSSSSSWASADLCSFTETTVEENLEETLSRPSTGWSSNGHSLWNSPWKHTRKEVRVTVAWARRCLARGDLRRPPGAVGLSARLGFLLARFIGALIPEGDDQVRQRPARELLLAQSCVEHLRAALCKPSCRWRRASPRSKRRRQCRSRLRRLQRLRRITTGASAVATVVSSPFPSTPRSSLRSSPRSSSITVPAPPFPEVSVAETESDTSVLDADERGECGGGDADRGGDVRDGGGDDDDDGAGNSGCDSAASSAELGIARGKVSDSDKDDTEENECACQSAVDITLASESFESRIDDCKKEITEEDVLRKEVCEATSDEVDTLEMFDRENESIQEDDTDYEKIGEAYLDEPHKELKAKEKERDGVQISDKYISDTVGSESSPTCIEVFKLVTEHTDALREQAKHKKECESVDEESATKEPIADDCRTEYSDAAGKESCTRDSDDHVSDKRVENVKSENNMTTDDKILDDRDENGSAVRGNGLTEVVNDSDGTSGSGHSVDRKRQVTTSKTNIKAVDDANVVDEPTDANHSEDESSDEFTDTLEVDESYYNDSEENSSEVNISDVIFNVDHHDGDVSNDDLSDSDITNDSDLDISSFEYTVDGSEVDRTTIEETNLENQGSATYQSSMKAETRNIEFSYGQSLQSDIPSDRTDESKAFSSVLGSVGTSLKNDLTQVGSIYFFTPHDKKSRKECVPQSSRTSTMEKLIADSFEVEDVHRTMEEDNEDDDVDSTDWWSQAVQLGSDCEDESCRSTNVKTTRRQPPVESHLFCDGSLESLSEIPSKSFSQVNPMETNKSTNDRCFSPTLKNISINSHVGDDTKRSLTEDRLSMPSNLSWCTHFIPITQTTGSPS